MHTSQYTEADFARAIERATQPRWSPCRDNLFQKTQAKLPLLVPEYDGSWYDPDQPYHETYKPFHKYISVHRPFYSAVSGLLHAGIVLQDDEWRKTAMSLALECAERVDFEITHYDSGMEFGNVSRMLCDVALGAADLMSANEIARAHARLRAVAVAITRCNEIWRTELRHMAFNNHRVTHMAELMAIGAVLGDDTLVDPAFNATDDRSFLNYLDGAGYDDGLCYESSLHYHYATASFLYRAAQTQRALLPSRPDLFRLRGAYGRTLEDYAVGPLAVTFSGLNLPRVGDTYGASTRIASKGLFYLAYALYGTPILGKLALDGEAGHPLLALMFGPEKPVDAPHPKVTSRLFAEHGYGVLVDDRGKRNQAFLTGDRSGIHCQRDSLQLQLEFANQPVLTCTDIKHSTHHAYSDSIHERFNRWPHAHSQLTVDDLDQKPHASPVPIREWCPDGEIRRMAMVDEAEQLQGGVHQGRFISMADGWVCDCVIAAASRPRTWRLFYHLAQGAPEGSNGADSGTTPGHSLFSPGNIKPLPTDDPWSFFRIDGSSVACDRHAWVSGPAKMSLATNTPATLSRFTIPKYVEERSGIIAETTGREVVFVTVYAHGDASGALAPKLLNAGCFGDEFIARWTVGSHRLQARILYPQTS